MREKQSKPTGSLHLSGARYPRGMNIAPEEVPNRPFFVKIGKDGVLVALRKLDDQLLSVSEGYRLMVSLTQPFCSLGWTREDAIVKGTYDVSLSPLYVTDLCM